ncbi:phage major capsid protein, HK97 [Castellaniella defragrans 65Phen]|uniref:Phage major capsid protein, HK97 n=1 Tax=Castellaniella defragrans (strain DSM 12143 / CCUG 39792 / 65Phen) TaxID=1437824 RepID=W8WVW0_CASD6|nr:phage major capsid protein [Castellaniella defragrans]CDM23868.1 phage major capsid protein, HK97 [Castellaniella defragrans 65Phen]
MKLHEIREARAAKVQEARALLDGEMTAEKKTAFDKLKAEITALEADEQRQAFIDEAERRAAGEPVDRGMADLESRVTLTEAIMAQVENRATTGALAEFNAEQARQGVTARRGGVLVPTSVFEKRATQTTTSQASIVPDDYRPDQFVGLLRNAMVMRSLGARVLTGLRGDTVIPKQTGASTAYWVSEGESLTESAPTFSTIKLQPRHVGALSAISRQLLQQANPSIEQLIRDDFVQVVGLAIDKAMIHGQSANDEPVGILNVSGIQTGSLATLDWDAIVALLEKLALKNVTANAILTHPKAASKLQTTLKETGLPGYLMQDGKVAGISTYVTNQLDAKTGTPATGRVLAGDFSQLIVGQWGSAEILANPYAAGYYEKGDIQLRIMATMDMVCREPNAFVLADDVAL